MPRISKSEEVFLSLGFRSSHSDGNLRTIELIGVRGQRTRNGECVVSDEEKRFFDDTVIRKIFAESRRIKDCPFEFLKIWLDSPNLRHESEYDIPTIKIPPDYEIRSNMASSRLKAIYILRDECPKGDEGRRWERNVEKIFSPLFGEFIAPPEMSESVGNSSFGKMIGNFTDALASSTDKYAKRKKDMFFDSLIVQID